MNDKIKNILFVAGVGFFALVFFYETIKSALFSVDENNKRKDILEKARLAKAEKAKPQTTETKENETDSKD